MKAPGIARLFSIFFEVLRDAAFCFLDEFVFVQIAQDFFDDRLGAARTPACPLCEIAFCRFADDVATVVGDAALCAGGEYGG